MRHGETSRAALTWAAMGWQGWGGEVVRTWVASSRQGKSGGAARTGKARPVGEARSGVDQRSDDTAGRPAVAGFVPTGVGLSGRHG